MSATNNMVHCQLWMGGLEPYMTESFILASFQRMGEKPMNVKVMRNKYTGEPAGYCFVHFENDDEAIDAMHKLNGKVIPNTNPPVRFRLNTASNQGKIMMNEREFSLWVGDLSPEVDDYTLFKCFAAKYQSIKAAKVILDAAGYSKGFGFLRFGLEDEQKHCLAHMNGYKGLGSKPLKISNAIPKSQRNPNSNGPQMSQQSTGYQYPPEYSHYYDPNYWQNYSQWSGYGYDPNSGYSYDPSSYAAQYGGQYPGQYGQYPPPSGGYPQQNYGYPHPPYPGGYYPPQTTTTGGPPPATSTTTAQSAAPTAAPVDDVNDVLDHSPAIDVEKENREYCDAILGFWVDLASSTLTKQEVFEEEKDKVKMIEVNSPTVNVKLENLEAAKRAIEAQFAPSLSDLSSMESSGSGDEEDESEEPTVKKRKLSTEVKIEVKTEDEEASTDEGKVGVKTETKEEPMDGVKEEDVKTEVKNEFQESMVEEKPLEEKIEESPEEIARKEQLRAEWGKVEGFMAAVDFDTIMNETESVSSESTDNESDAENEKGDVKSDKKALNSEEGEDKGKEGVEKDPEEHSHAEEATVEGSNEMECELDENGQVNGTQDRSASPESVQERVAEEENVSNYSGPDSKKAVIPDDESLDDRPPSSRLASDQEDAEGDQSQVEEAEPTSIVISEDESRTSEQSDALQPTKDQTNDVIVVNGDSQDQDQSSDQDSEASEDSNSDSD